MNAPLSLPQVPHLPVSALASAFDDVTNSYKFYWFLAILDSVQQSDERVIPLDLLLARMVASVWYPVNYFKLSFGKQDQLSKIVTLLGEQAQLAMDSAKPQVLQAARACIRQRDTAGLGVISLGDFVPYRFLRPFFYLALRGVKDWEVNRRIRQLAEQSFSSPRPCLYRLVGSPLKEIELHPDWHFYLKEHLAILTGFCLWHLVSYLQRNNPNVPNVAGKLFEPQQRDLTLARQFWATALQQLGHVACIYSGQPLPEKGFSIDHFLPWRFVAHDLLWNLVPTVRSVNSAKSDNLPDIAYVQSFAALQYQAVKAVSSVRGASKLLEDYVVLFKLGSVDDLRTMDFDKFRSNLRDVIAPQMQIAANMGFVPGWTYSP